MEGKVEERQRTLKELREKAEKEMAEAGPVLSRDQLHTVIAQLEQDTINWERVIDESITRVKDSQKEIEIVQLEVDKKKFEADTLQDKIKKLKGEIEAKNKPELNDLTGSVSKSAFSGATLKLSLTSEIEKLKVELDKEGGVVRLILGFSDSTSIG